MGIDPVHSPLAGGSTRTDAPAAGVPQPATPEAARSGTRQGVDARDAGDSIQLSSASLALHANAAASAGAPPSGTVSADRMRSVLSRVASGYYDQPGPRAASAAGVAR